MYSKSAFTKIGFILYTNSTGALYNLLYFTVQLFALIREEILKLEHPRPL